MTDPFLSVPMALLVAYFTPFVNRIGNSLSGLCENTLELKKCIHHKRRKMSSYTTIMWLITMIMRVRRSLLYITSAERHLQKIKCTVFEILKNTIRHSLSCPQKVSKRSYLNRETIIVAQNTCSAEAKPYLWTKVPIVCSKRQSPLSPGEKSNSSSLHHIKSPPTLIQLGSTH